MRRDEGKGRRKGGEGRREGVCEVGGTGKVWRVEEGGRSNGMRGKGHYKNVPPLVSNLHAFSNLCSPQ